MTSKYTIPLRSDGFVRDQWIEADDGIFVHHTTGRDGCSMTSRSISCADALALAAQFGTDEKVRA